MKYLRSIAAIVVGFIVMMIFNVGVQSLNLVLYPKDVVTDPALIKERLPTMPMGPLIVVVIAWEIGAFVGGLAAALIAGWARWMHAGLVGIGTLAATIMNFQMVPGHPNWMIIAGLVLPLPVSILAGVLVSPRSPSVESVSTS